MIYLTGDTHGGIDVRKLLDKKFLKRVKEGDYLIICGDFGFIWDYKKEKRKEKEWLDFFNNQKYTTLFVDGNHECFPRLMQYPQKQWNGGKIHVIREKVFHLMRGQVFEIEGQKIFTMGGASSHDRGPAVGNEKKVIGKSWWPEEIPSQEELNEGIENLKRNENKVDYIITHCLSSSDQYELKGDSFKTDILTEYFETLKHSISYLHWYGGHYHTNTDLSGNVSELYNRILEIGETVAASQPIPGTPIYQKGDRVCFHNQGNCYCGTIVGIYPWGKSDVKDQAVYDISLDDQQTIIHYVKEEDTFGYSCV